MLIAGRVRLAQTFLQIKLQRPAFTHKVSASLNRVSFAQALKLPSGGLLVSTATSAAQVHEPVAVLPANASDRPAPGISSMPPTQASARRRTARPSCSFAEVGEWTTALKLTAATNNGYGSAHVIKDFRRCNGQQSLGSDCRSSGQKEPSVQVGEVRSGHRCRMARDEAGVLISPFRDQLRQRLLFRHVTAR